MSFSISDGGRVAHYYLASAASKNNGVLKIDKVDNFNSNSNINLNRTT